MKKSKILLILSLLVTITACSNDDYVSKRHPEANTNQVEEEQVAEETSLEDNPENQEENSSNEDLQEENTDGIEGVNYKVNDIVNIRLYPSTDSDIVGEAHPGDEIMVILEADGWSRVNIDGQAGYIKSDLLEEVK